MQGGAISVRAREKIKRNRTRSVGTEIGGETAEHRKKRNACRAPLAVATSCN